jgi:DDE superfamily endonuclease
MTASSHDAAAFANTGAALYPDFFFQGNEFAWADSAYTCTSRMIPVHKQPASEQPQNAAFDKMVSEL